MKEIKVTAKIVKLEKILLDPKNPRFLSKDIIKCSKKEIHTKKVQSRISKLIMTRHHGKLLKDSIRQVGFLKIDHIVCVPHNVSGKEYYLLIEGNRRIAAAQELKEDIEKLNVEVKPFVLESLNEIEVLVLGTYTKDIIWLIQGLRHISGIAEWKAFEKAQAIKNLYISCDNSTRTVGEIIGRDSKEIGDYLRALAIYETAQKDDDFGSIVTPDKWDFFAHLATAPDWKKWLEFKEDSCLFKSETKNLENLNRFLSWLVKPSFSTEDLEIPADEKPKLTAGRELRQVRKLIKHGDEALTDFEEEGLVAALEKHDEVKRKIIWPTKVKAAIKALKEMGIEDVKKAAQKKNPTKFLKELEDIVKERIEDITMHAEKQS